MVKIVHIKILDGEVSDVVAIKKQLDKIKENKEYSFIITNDRIEVHDIKNLLDEIYNLYKQYKKTKEKK